MIESDDPTIRRLIANSVEDENGCFVWQRGKGRGYGVIRIPGGRSSARVHRVAYEILVGPIADQLDHLCRNRACWNPEHLEDVDSRTNLLRGDTVAAKNAAKTRCPQGHEYRVYPSGRRRCTVCELASERVRRPGHHY
jgi:hypothetical protein